MGEKWCLGYAPRVLLHAANLQNGTDNFTSLPKEGVLRIFYRPLKIRRLRADLNPRTWVSEASTLPLHHRSRLCLKAVYDDTPYRASNICFWYPVAVGLTRTLQSLQSPFCTYSTSHPDTGRATVNRKPFISSLALGSKERQAYSIYWATQCVFW